MLELFLIIIKLGAAASSSTRTMSISRSCCCCLLLLAAIHSVSIFSIAADISLRAGDLALVNTADAIGFMSGITMDKGNWLQLGNSSVHPEALLRFMVLGAPPEGVLPNSSWGYLEEEEVKKLGGLLATRDASIAESTFHQAVQGMGSLHVNAWMLGFVCVGSLSPCQTLTPAAIVNRTDEASGATCLEFTTVWDKLVPGSSNTTLVSNTLTAKLVNASKKERIIKQGEGSLDKFSVNVLSKPGMEACPSTSMQIAVRSTLNAAYNLGPYACYQIDPAFARVAGSEYLLVLGVQNSTTTSNSFVVEGIGPDYRSSYSQESDYSSPSNRPYTPESSICIKRWLQNFQNVELGKCKDSPRLLISMTTDGPDSLNQDIYAVACRINYGSSAACLQFYPTSNMTDTECDNMMFTAFNSSFIPDMKSGTITRVNMSSNMLSGINYIRGSSSYGLPTDNLCEAGGNFLKSTLTSSIGADYDHELSYSNNPLAVNAEALGLLFTELNNNYAQAHSDAFQLANGSPANFPSTVVAFVGAAISVLAATVPFTNFLLCLLVKVSGTLGGSANSRYFKMAALTVLNVVLALVCYGAIVQTIESEAQRSKEFKTWAVIADTMAVNVMGLQLQALYVVHAESKYESRMLIFIYILWMVLVVLVGGLTLQRCCDVLKKLELIIKEYAKESSGSAGDPDVPASYRAIDMSASEYIKLSFQYARQPGPAATSGDDHIDATTVPPASATKQNAAHAAQLDANSTNIQLAAVQVHAKFKQVGLVALIAEKLKHANDI